MTSLTALKLGMLTLLLTTPLKGHAKTPLAMLHVVERAISEQIIDIGTEGDSLGDKLIFANPIYDQANQVQIGTSNGYCIRTVVGQAWECSWTVSLSNGTVSTTGTFFDDKETALFTIAGGTGDYSQVRGQMHLKTRSQAKEYDFIYKFDE
jgi:hypothetical protein